MSAKRAAIIELRRAGKTNSEIVKLLIAARFNCLLHCYKVSRTQKY